MQYQKSVLQFTHAINVTLIASILPQSVIVNYTRYPDFPEAPCILSKNPYPTPPKMSYYMYIALSLVI